MTEPRRAWEKACPTCGGHGIRLSPLQDELPCLGCHGTGVVPMTTDEMLEALRTKCDGWCDLRFDRDRGEWMFSAYRYSVTPAEFHGPTPDDALRAALESVSS